MKAVKLVGILNVTPDSFSDGGKFYHKEDAVHRLHQLVKEGADIVDIGGDSTRPGSICVGEEEEWDRIKDIVNEGVDQVDLSLDTHFSKTASRGIERGVKYINDISAGSDSEMFSVIAASSAKIVLMYSKARFPHDFREDPKGDILVNINNFFESILEKALKAGVRKEQIILDPGMGGFIHSDPKVSWNLIERFNELEIFGCPLMLAVSRKGFLKQPGESRVEERDEVSARIAKDITNTLNLTETLYIRTHSITATHQYII